MALIWSWKSGRPITLNATGNDVIIKKTSDYFHAAVIGDIEYIQNYIESGKDINYKNEDGWTALMFASFNDNAESVSILIHAGAGINIKNNDGETALILCLKKVHTEISTDPRKRQYETVKLLLDAGAELNITDNKGFTAMKLAALDYRDKIRKLIKNKLNRFSD